MERQLQTLLFTVTKILRRRLLMENDHESIEQIRALDQAVGDLRNYVPFREAPP